MPSWVGQTSVMAPERGLELTLPFIPGLLDFPPEAIQVQPLGSHNTQSHGAKEHLHSFREPSA